MCALWMKVGVQGLGHRPEARRYHAQPLSAAALPHSMSGSRLVSESMVEPAAR